MSRRDYMREYMRKWRAENKDKDREIRKRYWERKEAETGVSRAEYMRKYRKKLKESGGEGSDDDK